MVLVLVIGSIQLATERLLLTSAAAEISRLEARGDSEAAQAVVARLSGIAGVQMDSGSAGPLWCVTLSANPVGGMLGAIKIAGSACAAVSAVDTVSLNE